MLCIALTVQASTSFSNTVYMLLSWKIWVWGFLCLGCSLAYLKVSSHYFQLAQFPLFFPIVIQSILNLIIVYFYNRVFFDVALPRLTHEIILPQPPQYWESSLHNHSCHSLNCNVLTNSLLLLAPLYRPTFHSCALAWFYMICHADQLVHRDPCHWNTSSIRARKCSFSFIPVTFPGWQTHLENRHPVSAHLLECISKTVVWDCYRKHIYLAGINVKLLPYKLFFPYGL